MGTQERCCPALRIESPLYGDRVFDYTASQVGIISPSLSWRQTHTHILQARDASGVVCLSEWNDDCQAVLLPRSRERGPEPVGAVGRKRCVFQYLPFDEGRLCRSL